MRGSTYQKTREKAFAPVPETSWSNSSITGLARLRKWVLSLIEPKNKLKWKQKHLRVLSLTNLVFLTFFELGSTSQEVTLAMAQILAPFPTHRRIPLTHKPH